MKVGADSNQNSEKEELFRDILAALQTGRFEISGHGSWRMQQRNVTKRDIMCVGGKGVVTESGESEFKVQGNDCDGDDLTVVVGIEDGVIVVTVF